MMKKFLVKTIIKAPNIRKSIEGVAGDVIAVEEWDEIIEEKQHYGFSLPNQKPKTKTRGKTLD